MAILLTWPTIEHLSTYLPGDGGDDPAIAWNLWWVKYALLNEGQNPFLADFIFYPVGINLAFYTLTVFNAVTSLPILLNFGVVSASNLHMLFTFAIGAYGTFLLVRYELATIVKNKPESNDLVWISAAIAGGFYAFASSKLFYVALGQFNIASNHWVPFTVLYVLRTRHHPHRLKNPILAGLFMTMQAWTEMTYATFLLMFIGLYWLYWLLVRDKKPASKSGAAARAMSQWKTMAPHLRAVVVMGLTFAIGISPFLAQMLPDMRAEGDFLLEGSGFADVFSADVLGFLIPTMHHPLLGQLVQQTNIEAFEKGQHIFIGFTLLGLMLVTLLTGYRNPVIRFWLVATFIFALLCLGPVITVNGRSTGIPGPFILLQQLPFFKGNRYPSRYSVILLLCLSMLAGYGLVQVGSWLSNRSSLPNTHYANRILYLLLILIPFIFLFEHLSAPLPQSDMRVPTPYQTIAADPDDFTVLDIPLAWRNGFRITGPLTTQFMFGQFYQTLHQKRLLQGNTSRNPPFKFQYFTEAPVINSLLALATGHPLHPAQLASNQAIAADVLHFFDIKYVVIRPFQYAKFNGTEYITVDEQASIPYVEQVLPVEKIHDEDALKIYRTREDTTHETELQSGLLIDTATPLATLYFGEGWGHLNPGQPVAAQRREVRLLLPLTEGPQHITLRTRLPDGFQDHSQSVSLELNGWQSSAQSVGQEWQELIFDLPAGVAQPGVNDLRLHFAHVVPLPGNSDPETVADKSLARPHITILSAGQEVGDFGHIFVNGYEVSPNQRGYNVAVIEPDGNVLAADSFDTHLDSTASKALADFIATAPAKAFIAIAAADEASANLGQEAVSALRSIGATEDLRGCFRCSHAILYDPFYGTTFEARDALRPAGVVTGLGLTEPSVTAVVDWIRVEPVGE